MDLYMHMYDITYDGNSIKIVEDTVVHMPRFLTVDHCSEAGGHWRSGRLGIQYVLSAGVYRGRGASFSTAPCELNQFN